MQRDLDRMLIRRRRLKRGIVLVSALFLLAAVLVWSRACSDRFQEPYNKGYQPLDERRLPARDLT